MKRRSKLMLLALSALVLGGLITTFAVTTDSAQTGTNRIDSGANPAADLQISHDAILATSYGQAPYSGNCNTDPPGGSYVDNQTVGFGATSGLINQTNATPKTMAAGAQVTYFCVKANGEAAITLTGEDLASAGETDIACSAGEAAVDGASCGSGAGELRSEISQETYVGPVDGTCRKPGDVDNVASLTRNGLGGGVIAFSSPVSMTAGSTRCIAVAAGYLDSNTTSNEEIENQTDRVEWSLRYNATT